MNNPSATADNVRSYSKVMGAFGLLVLLPCLLSLININFPVLGKIDIDQTQQTRQQD